MAILSASLTTFAVTNIDDAFLLTLLYARRIPGRRIVAGQYLGFAVIVVLSLALALGALTMPHRWMPILGLLPLTLGIRHLVRTCHTRADLQNEQSFGVVSVAMITISNGADNVGVYVPFFVFGREYLWLILTIYAALIAVWCFVGKWLGRRRLVFRLLERSADRVVAMVFILLGILILIRR